MIHDLNIFKGLITCIVLLLVGHVCAQQVDSLYVFKVDAPGPCTSASANALIWRLHHQDAEHDLVVGASLGTAMDAMKEYEPTRFAYGMLDDLKYLIMAFSGGRPMAVGVTEDLGRVINFTARKEYRISSWEEHLRVRALMAKLLLQQ